jgi:sterol desaturase/sphingolipid hydroxylase (fatty acid hydroxylase superfamily)
MSSDCAVLRALSPRPRVERTHRVPDVPSETSSSVLFGLAVHLGPAVAFIALLETFGATLALALPAFFLLSLVNLAVVLEAERRAPCVELSTPTNAQIRSGLSLVFLKGVALGSAVVVGGWWLLSLPLGGPGITTGWMPILAAVLLTDAMYYWIHRSLNHGKGKDPIRRWYRRNHVIHHLVEELDFFRGNHSSVMDTAVTGFQVPLVILATLFGLDLTSTLIAYGLVLMLQATHHVNHTFDLGPLRFFFMDNHAHKLHHCKGGRLVNHGALFSVWDRCSGTYFEDWTMSANHLADRGLPLPVRRVRESGWIG